MACGGSGSHSYLYLVRKSFHVSAVAYVLSEPVGTVSINVSVSTSSKVPIPQTVGRVKRSHLFEARTSLKGIVPNFSHGFRHSHLSKTTAFTERQHVVWGMTMRRLGNDKRHFPNSRWQTRAKTGESKCPAPYHVQKREGSCAISVRIQVGRDSSISSSPQPLPLIHTV